VILVTEDEAGGDSILGLAEITIADLQNGSNISNGISSMLLWVVLVTNHIDIDLNLKIPGTNDDLQIYIAFLFIEIRLDIPPEAEIENNVFEDETEKERFMQFSMLSSLFKREWNIK
jgi:hypothetical protein